APHRPWGQPQRSGRLHHHGAKAGGDGEVVLELSLPLVTVATDHERLSLYARLLLPPGGLVSPLRVRGSPVRVAQPGLLRGVDAPHLPGCPARLWPKSGAPSLAARRRLSAAPRLRIHGDDGNARRGGGHGGTLCLCLSSPGAAALPDPPRAHHPVPVPGD